DIRIRSAVSAVYRSPALKEIPMKRFLLCVTIAAATAAAQAAGGGGGGGGTEAEKPVTDHIGNAHKALHAKDYDRAMKELEAAYREEPRSPDVHNLIGYTYRVRAKPDLA